MMLPWHDIPWVLAGVAAAGGLTYLLRRRRKSADEVERERQQWINSIGRITDGTLVDVQEVNGSGSSKKQVIVYQYDVAGVSYEASQDITHLWQGLNLHTSRLGVPTSVKYDPHNPGNSIVASESWVGLRRS
jgi:LPXTG-motif cell wall-anchored protein